MPASGSTPTLSLPQYADGDKFSRLGDLNSAFAKIDAKATSTDLALTAVQGNVTTQLAAMQTQVDAVVAKSGDQYTKEQTDAAITAGDEATLGTVAAGYVSLTGLSAALTPYAKSADVAPRVHTHASSDIVDLTGVVQSIVNDRVATIPTGAVVLQGTLVARPAAAGLVDGTVYRCTDLPETYMALSGAWVLWGAGGQTLAFGENTSRWDGAGTGQWEDVAGTLVTFKVGSAAIMIDINAEITCDQAVQYGVMLDSARVVLSTVSYTGASGFQTNVHLRKRITGLTPGSTHTAKIQIASSGKPALNFANQVPTDILVSTV